MQIFIIGLYYLMTFYLFLIAIVIISSWIPSIHNSNFMKPFKVLTNAYMEPFRGFLVIGIFDFTPVVGVILLSVMRNIVGSVIG